MSKKQTPSDFLKQIIGRPVVVKLNSGVDYRGELSSFPDSTNRRMPWLRVILHHHGYTYHMLTIM